MNYHSRTMPIRKPKRFLALKVILPLLAVIFSLIFLEIGLRIFGGDIKDIQSPKILKRKLFPKMLEEAKELYPPSDPLFSLVLDREKLIQKNYPSLGISLRDYDYSIEKPEASYRIIGLGDSFAWGWGVPDNRLTMFKYLECWLNAANRGRHFEVINCAQPGTAVEYYETFLKQYGKEFQPDMVIVVFNLNDPYISHASMVVDRRTEVLLQEQQDWLSEKSRLYNFIKKRILKKKVNDYTISNIKDSYFGPMRSQRWEKAQDDIKKIQAFCREEGIELIIAIFPLLFELERKYPFADEVREVERFMKSAQIKTINLLSVFDGKKTFVLWSSPTDSHPNEVAHRLAAEAIYRFLVAEDFLKITP
jgi:hypothetical protein